MAGCMVARRIASRIPKLCSAPHERLGSARGFASATAKVKDDSSVEIGQKGEDKAVSSQFQERAVPNQSRGWPTSVFPSLFSPLMSYPSSLLRPASLMQMMDTVDRVFSSMEPPSIGGGVRPRTPWDVMEDDKCFKMRMDMPGMARSDVKLSVEDGDLVVKAEHNVEEGEDDWSSRSYGSYSARIKLPETVDVGAIKAEMKDGALKVIAPKVEGVKQKHEVHIE